MIGNRSAIFVGKRSYGSSQGDLHYGMTGRMVRYKDGTLTFIPDKTDQRGHVVLDEYQVSRRDLYLQRR
jgi:hypothetical protein